MLLDCEKVIINKGYDEYEGVNIWNFYKKEDNKAQITLRIDKLSNDYVFSFPLNNSKFSYRIEFKTFEEAKNYIEYIVLNYI